MQILVPLWHTLTWRREGWWNLLVELDLLLRECARFTGDSETLIAVEWELLNNHFGNRPVGSQDFASCLDGLRISHPEHRTVVEAKSVVSCLPASFAFGAKEGHVGEALPAQLIVSSRAHPNSAPITLFQIRLAFSRGLKDISIQHDSDMAPDTVSSDGSVHLHNLSLNKGAVQHTSAVPSSPNSLLDSQASFGLSDLKFSAGITKAFSFTNILYNAGTVEALSITLCMREPLFEFDIVASDEEQLSQDVFWVTNTTGLEKTRLRGERNNIVKILPKPPKIRIEIPDLVKPYLTDEKVFLNISVFNEEEEDANVNLELRLHNQSEFEPGINWALDGAELERSKALNQDEYDRSVSNGQISYLVGEMHPLDVRFCKLSLRADFQAAQYGLEVKACYCLSSDPETLISKTLVTNVVFIRPFEANHEFLPRISPMQWPNYFHINDEHNPHTNKAERNMKADGLSQRWVLKARIASFAAEPMLLESVELRVLHVSDRAIPKIEAASDHNNLVNRIFPDEVQERQFEVDVQKLDLEDRRSTVLSLQLQVRWRRQNSADGPATMTEIAVPDLTIPFGEPRVLASACKGQGNDGLIHLDYIIENPSVHVLTFKITMEPSDEFAFVGAKDTSLQLVPLSRHSVHYNIYPLVRGTWINPQFKVMDTHFRKMLKVHATEGIRMDKKGVLIWIDTED